MRTRKEMKRQARAVVRSHYWILLTICLVAAFLGAEFSGSLDVVKRYEASNVETEGLSTGATTGVYGSSSANAVLSALQGNIEEGKEIAQEAADEAIEEAKTDKKGSVLGRSRGVFAEIVNGIDSGSVIVNLISAARSIGMSQSGVMILFIVLAAFLSVGVWFLLTNIYKAISRRIFLEARIYEKVPLQRMIFFLRVKKWLKVAVTMFMAWLFEMLWSLTIVGGVIKRYSYYMVPYIAAENPDAGWKETIDLSRKMMDGHKWECFVFEISFILWNILETVTLGISGLFYTNQYKVASFSEYYADLRKLAKENNISGSELLNDTYLFEKAETGLLREAYADVIQMAEMPEEKIPLTGIRGFLADVFGITVFNREDERRFQESEERSLKINSMKSIINGREYPGRLFTIAENRKNRQVEHIHYLRHYSIPSLILLYFIFAFIGWTWEVSLHLISDGTFVNRGVLHGPWLPIYGTGGILILTVLNKFRKRPLAGFFATVVLCGCVEYFTAYYLEMTHNGQKWWDYSGYFLNLHGRICAEGLLVFGLGGMAIVYFAAPLLDNHLRKIKYSILIPLCAALLIVFSCDQVYSKKHPNTGKGITSYASAKEVSEPIRYQRI